MSLHRYGAKRDLVEGSIVRALEAHGCSVDRVSKAGFPDLIVFRGGRLVALAEVKARKGTLTKAQVIWRARHNGPPPVTLRTIDDALELVRSGSAGLQA